MKRSLLILAAGLAACSSSSNPVVPPPTPTTYSYNSAPAAPTVAQQSAAANVGSSAGSVAIAATGGSVSQNAQTLSSAPDLPLTVASLATAEVAPPPGTAAEVIGKLVQMRRTGELDTAGCNYTVSGNTINYNNCTITDTASNLTITVNGSLTETTSGSATTLSWNITVSFSISSTSGQSFTEAFTGTEAGNVTFTATSATTGTISGSETFGVSGNYNSSQENISFAYTAQLVFNNTQYDSNCSGWFVGGSMDVSWTLAGTQNGQAISGFHDFGLRFEWSGCDTATVVTGTPG